VVNLVWRNIFVSDAVQLGQLPRRSDVSDLERGYEKSGAPLGLTFAEFCELTAQFSASSHLEDLLLARACALGREPAWDRFLVLYRAKLYGFAAAIAKEDSKARELADSVYADLFGTRESQDGQRISKLQSYSGRGSLEGWLRTVLAQEYVNHFRRERKFVSFDETIDSGAQDPLQAPEQPLLAKVTDAALASLSNEDRLLLSAYYLDGRTLAEIGRMLSLHESSISRRLEKILSTLRKRIVTALRSVGFSHRAAEEMLDVDVRDLSVDVRNRLAQERGIGTFSG
jgi:RNA polymerase sigma-70 factor, ECF subfamily